MAESTRYYIPDLLVLGVDEFEDHDFEGRLWTQYQEEPYIFHNGVEAIQKAEHFFDEIQFPQRATVQRSFMTRGGEGVQKRILPDEVHKKRMEQDKTKDIENERGRKGTFIVQVKYRQNSTWQGEVTWAEKNKKVYFRSALELMKLMDEALSSEDTEPAE